MRIAPVVLAAAAAALAACSGKEGPVDPKDDLCLTSSATQPTRVELGVGQSRQLLDASNECVLLVGGERYLVTVGNSNVNSTDERNGKVNQTAGFQLVGAPAASASVAAGPGASPFAQDAPFDPATAFGGGALDAQFRRRLAAHHRMLELNEQLMRGMPSPTAAWAEERARRRSLGVSLATAGPSLTVGTVGEVRILNRDDPGGTLCKDVNYLSIRARTVYVGTHSIVLEDSLSPLAGQMDTTYVRLAQEFDNTMYSILLEYFGNPLAMDAGLDNNGKVVMVFSPRINAFGDIGGFVLNCDLFPRAAVPVSNEGEYFYAVVPDSLRGGILNWDRSIRPTLIHEVKHVTANAERISRGGDVERRWLEEGTAVLAEELWARTVFGNTWKGNATYQQTLFCEIRPTSTVNTQCRGKPFVMYGTYASLYDYLVENEKYSPLGEVEEGDFVFYASAWNLVRWAADNYASSEPAFFKALVQSSTDYGTTNLAKRTGRPWPELLADWSMALAVDDRAGVTPARSQLSIPSWNTRNIFAGMANEQFVGTNPFSRSFPLQARTPTTTSFTQTVSSLRGGSFSLFELPGGGSQALELQLRNATGSGAPPAGLVMNVMRIQ